MDQSLQWHWYPTSLCLSVSRHARPFHVLLGCTNQMCFKSGFEPNTEPKLLISENGATLLPYVVLFSADTGDVGSRYSEVQKGGLLDSFPVRTPFLGPVGQQSCLLHGDLYCSTTTNSSIVLNVSVRLFEVLGGKGYPSKLEKQAHTKLLKTKQTTRDSCLRNNSRKRH